jgi:hypothetical protein
MTGMNSSSPVSLLRTIPTTAHTRRFSRHAHEIDTVAGAMANEGERECWHVPRERRGAWRVSHAVLLEIGPHGGVIPRVQHLNDFPEAPFGSGLHLRQRCRVRLRLLRTCGGRHRQRKRRRAGECCQAPSCALYHPILSVGTGSTVVVMPCQLDALWTLWPLLLQNGTRRLAVGVELELKDGPSGVL